MTAVARTHAAVGASGTALVAARDDCQGAGHHGEAELLGSGPEQCAGRFFRYRRHRVILRHRRDEGRIDALTGDAHLPLGLRVVGLKFIVRNGPISQTGTGDLADGAGFVELPGQVPPTAAAVGDGAAAHDAAGAVGSGFSLIFVSPAERITLAGPIAHEPIFGCRVAVEQLVLGVVPLVSILAPAALFENDDGETRDGQLLSHDAARSSGADDDEIHFGVWRVSLHDVVGSD